jgi:hypothetical protein
MSVYAIGFPHRQDLIAGEDHKVIDGKARPLFVARLRQTPGIT